MFFILKLLLKTLSDHDYRPLPRINLFFRSIGNHPDPWFTQPFPETLPGLATLTKDLWIFPDYSLGIRTQGASLQELVRQRTRTNLYLLVGLDIVLIVAVVLAFRNIKREVQLAQNKTDFVSNVSHEIRTPLALISMFAETLELDRVKSEEKKHEYYSIINKETQRLTGIVNKILNFSQTEAKNRPDSTETN